MPITAIVLLLSFTLAPEMPVGTLVMFLLGAILLIVGMGLFSLGADMAMMPMFLCGVLQEVPMSHKFATLIRTT